MVTVRKARLEDVDEIARINKQLADMHAEMDEIYKKGAKVEEGFRKHVENLLSSKDDALVVVAEEDGNIIGYMIGVVESARPFLKIKKMGRISDACVGADHRKKGIGEKMFNFLLDWFREKGVEYITLSFDHRNEGARAFWRKMGFEEWMVRVIKRIN